MKVRSILIISMCCLFIGMNTAYAENKRIYSYNEQWYMQVQSGVGLLFAESTIQSGLFKTAQGAYSAAVGKNISTILGFRIQVLGGGDKGWAGIGHDEFTFKHVGVYEALTFNITSLLRGTKAGKEKPWNLEVLAGHGYVRSYGFDTGGKTISEIDTEAHNLFSVLCGVSLSYTVNKHFGINLDVLAHAAPDSYNGIVVARKYEGALNTCFGLRYIF